MSQSPGPTQGHPANGGVFQATRAHCTDEETETLRSKGLSLASVREEMGADLSHSQLPLES